MHTEILDYDNLFHGTSFGIISIANAYGWDVATFLCCVTRWNVKESKRQYYFVSKHILLVALRKQG
jgi:hypothetical protein